MKEFNIIIMYSEELKRNVKVYISLPENYDKEDKSYPVLYMTEGQILFNDYDDYDGTSWGMLESYKNDKSLPGIILVGIGSTAARVGELLPFSFENRRTGKSVGGHAKEYLDFIVNTVKPVINKKYNALTSPEHTGILGFSIGGVCATYAATTYSNHFSLFGAVSSAYIPIRDKMVELVKQSDFSTVKKLYLDVGTNESENETRRDAYVESNQQIFDILEEKMDKKRLECSIIKDGQHIEADWDNRVPSIIAFLFNE
ncbi:MAG: putative esterase [Candidatus Izimaplasma bacterium HR2]|nr:MAG: putative esterase [Candidatus Izimaplasma bacterium HR2]